MEQGAERRTARVLFIEGDERIRALISTALSQDGLVFRTVCDGAAGISALQRDAIDLILLDVALPDIDGFDLLAAIRTARPRLPVIVLAAEEDETSRLAAFGAGADDCINAPFSLAELALRIQARLRRSEEGGTLLEVGPLSLDLASHRASLGNRSVLLSAREASLLAAFARHAGEVLSRKELLSRVWELDFEPVSNVVEVYVSSLRRKLGREVVETVRGRGYRLRISTLTAAVADPSCAAPLHQR